MCFNIFHTTSIVMRNITIFVLLRANPRRYLLDKLKIFLSTPFMLFAQGVISAAWALVFPGSRGERTGFNLCALIPLIPGGDG